MCVRGTPVIILSERVNVGMQWGPARLLTDGKGYKVPETNNHGLKVHT